MCRSRKESFHDPWQLTALCTIGVGILFVFVYFVVVGNSSHEFISDWLVSSVLYRFCLTGLVVISLLFCLLYFWRHREGQVKLASAGGGFAGGAIKSWIVLVAVRDDTYPMLHAVAVLAFVINSGVYTCILVALEMKENVHRYDKYSVWLILVFVTVVLTSSYLGLYFAQSPSAWVLEHVGFLVFNMSQFVFFWYHSFTHPKPYISVAFPLNDVIY